MIHQVSIAFRSDIWEEGSWGANKIAEDVYNVMSFTPPKDGNFGTEYGYIEWVIGDDAEVYIAVWFNEHGIIEDYDGVMSLPYEACTLLEKAGVTIPQGFL